MFEMILFIYFLLQTNKYFVSYIIRKHMSFQNGIFIILIFCRAFKTKQISFQWWTVSFSLSSDLLPIYNH